MEIMFANYQMDRPVLAPAGTPAEHVALLRSALKATLEDPGFMKDAAKLSIRYVSGEEVAALLKKLYSSAPTVLKEVAKVMGAQ